MSEPSLSCGPLNEARTYRFTWLRAKHHPIAIRVNHVDGRTHLIAVELDGAGGYRPGVVARRVDRDLSAAQWESLVTALEQARFWRMPTNRKGLGTMGRSGSSKAEPVVATTWLTAGRPNQGRIETRDLLF